LLEDMFLVLDVSCYLVLQKFVKLPS